jgi:hypothetical protein
MGRQLRFYILPEETDQLLSELKASHGLRILSPKSDNARPFESESATANYIEIGSTGVYSFGQYYLVSGTDAKTPMHYLEELEKWHIDLEQSEAIELSTCNHGSGILSQGRLYFQKDMLAPAKDAILQKNPDFVKWAETIFRSTKKSLRYSRELEAYVAPVRCVAPDWWEICRQRL